MELPLGGPALRHYTQSRPRPHRQKLNYRPSRPQETIIESENEALEHMGRVDEGVEEFFTKRVLPADTQTPQDEESSITVHEVAPASSVPCPPPTKTLRRKLGDFFTLKKRRGLKSEASQELRPKKASIADLIRPLREVARAEKDKDRVREVDKENEKEKGKEAGVAVTGDSSVQETAVSAAPPLRSEAVPPRRALREGKSQSLILLSGSAAAAAGSTNAKNTAKKQFEGQHSFEQKLHLMLQRIGVSKAQPGETQSQEGEMKKAESEGTIIDSKPEPPPTFTKPRTMSASSDTRHQIRPSVSAHESAGKPALPPKPVIKSGPPPTTSGRNTPENELAKIQEGETQTPTKLSPTEASSTPAPTDPPVPDSTHLQSSPSGTVAPADADVCSDSVSSAAAEPAAMNVTERHSRASVPEGNVSGTTALLSPSTSTPPTSPPAPPSVMSSSSEFMTQSHSVTSSSATITSPSVTTETISSQSNDTNLSAPPCLPNRTSADPITADPITADPISADPISADPITADLITADPISADPISADPISADPISADPISADPISADPITADLITADPISADPISADPITADPITADPITADPFLADPITDDPFSADPISADPISADPISASAVTTSTLTSSAPDGSTSISVTTASSVDPISCVAKTTAPPPDSNIPTHPAPVSPDASTGQTLPVSTAPLSSDTTSPTTTDCMTSISPPAPAPAPDLSASSSSSGAADHLDGISTTAAAISSQPTTEPEPINTSTTLTPAGPCPPISDSWSPTSHPLTGPPPSSGRVGQDDEEGSSLEPAATLTADEPLQTTRKNQNTDEEHKTPEDGGKVDEREQEQPAPVSGEGRREEEAQEDGTGTDEEDKKAAAVDEAPSGKESE
ncbi:uncharacterized protein LOC142990304 [Genypterus blacodes]|uniref:uncharacterized protein LOC142990304 n=1 Tax=Genypterus blacodes TaxID=154954 RepID=UPI003F772F8C